MDPISSGGVSRSEISVFVYCPIGVQTGGPEALHQLVFTLRELGVQAALVPTPSTRKFKPVAAYEHYACPIVPEILDAEGRSVVVPESELQLLLGFKKARHVVWWLSIDNSTLHEIAMTRTRSGLLSRELAQVFKRRFEHVRLGQYSGRRAIVKALDRASHVAQSAYAVGRLADEFGIAADVLSDFTYKSSELPQLRDHDRGSRVAYNPAKGKAFIDELSIISDFDLIPIEGLDAEGVRERLSAAAVYVDLGHHPGRDRMPREAALCDSIVIAGRRGAASLAEDLPISDELKVDMAGSRREVALRARAVIQRVLSDQDYWRNQQQGVREQSKSEQDRFTSEVRHLFVEWDSSAT